MHTSKQLTVLATAGIIYVLWCFCNTYVVRFLSSHVWQIFRFFLLATYAAIVANYDSCQAMYKNQLPVVSCDITCAQSNFCYLLCNS